MVFDFFAYTHQLSGSEPPLLNTLLCPNHDTNNKTHEPNFSKLNHPMSFVSHLVMFGYICYLPPSSTEFPSHILEVAFSVTLPLDYPHQVNIMFYIGLKHLHTVSALVYNTDNRWTDGQQTTNHTAHSWALGNNLVKKCPSYFCFFCQ